MPVTFTYELDELGAGATAGQTQIGALFQRLGWERLGASSYRYPSLVAEHEAAAAEDWFNHVVPALMLFRCYVLTHRLIVKNITLDAQSSTGYRRAAGFGAPPCAAEDIKLSDPTSQSGRPGDPPRDGSHDEQEWAMLEDWLDAIDFPFGL